MRSCRAVLPALIHLSPDTLHDGNPNTDLLGSSDKSHPLLQTGPDGVLFFESDSRTPQHFAFRSGSGETRIHPFHDDGALELREYSHHLK